jgi:MSHA biogenesis protein MshG
VPVFTYKARNARGELLSGRMDGGTSDAVADQLIRSGITPVEIKVLVSKSETSQLFGNFFDQKITDFEIMLFARQMSSLLKAGVPILRALSSLSETTVHIPLQRLLNDLRDGLSAGRELSACLRKHAHIFPPFFINMVRVGESTGRLDEIFMRLFTHLEFERDMRTKVKGALRYPTFVIIALGIALAIINVFVIPAFANVFKGAGSELPLMTRILIGFSAWTVKYWPYLLGGVFASYFGFRRWKKTPKGLYLFDRWLLKAPIAGKIVHKAALARFAKSLAMTYQSGVPIVQGLANTAKVVDNAYIASRIEQMRDGVERGDSLTRSANTTGVFTPIVLQMMAVGEETGELDRLLFEIGDLQQREVEYEIRTLSDQIEPLLLAGLGAIVLVLALGIFLPMWDLGAAMKK